MLGLGAASACFILPAASITLVFAWAYVKFRTVPQADALLYGIKPAVLAVIAGAVWLVLGGAAAVWVLKTMVLG